MRVRRHFGPIQELKFDARLWRWVGIGAGMVLAGYLTAYLILFRVPILPGHHAVPRVLGLTVAEAQAEIQKAKLQVTDGRAEAHPTAPAGRALAPGAGLTIVVSRGAPTIPIPDLLGMASADARTRLETEGLQLGTVTRRRTSDASPGTVVAQSPAAGTLAAPGTVIDIVVARSPQ